jgi:hypothetical protein
MAQLPTDPSFSSVDFKVNTPLLRTSSLSGITRRVAMGHQYYSFTINYPTLTAKEAGKVNGFLAARLGGFDSFTVVIPELSYSKAAYTTAATMTVTTAKAAGSTSTTYTVGGSHASSEFLVAGDFIKFSNHGKVYMVTEDSTTDGSGNATVNFSGGLVAAITTATTITRNAVPFTVILDADVQEFAVGNGGLTSMNFDVKEVW